MIGGIRGDMTAIKYYKHKNDYEKRDGCVGTV